MPIQLQFCASQSQSQYVWTDIVSSVAEKDIEKLCGGNPKNLGQLKNVQSLIFFFLISSQNGIKNSNFEVGFYSEIMMF
jgi:hypothetical protein